MYSSTVTSLLGILALLSPSHAKTTFIKPPPDGSAGDYDTNPRYESGKPIEITFRTDLEHFNIAVFQDYPLVNGVHGYFWQKILDNTDKTTLTWTPDAADWGTERDKDLVLYILVFALGESERDGASHYFNVTVPSVPGSSSSSSSTSSSTTSSRPSSVSTTATTSTPSPEASKSPSAQGDENATNGEPISSSGLSTGAKAGIGIGVAAGLLGIIAAVVFFLRMRRKKGAAGAQMQEKTQEPQVQELAGSAPPVFEAEGYYAPSAYKDSTSPPAR